MRFARDGTAPSSCGTTSPLRMLRKGPLCFLSFSSSAHCWQQEWCLLQVCGLPFLCLCSLSPPLFFFNCIEDFKIRIVSCSYPIHCQCLLLPLYPALLLIPWSLAPLLLPLFTQKLCTSQSAMLYRLGKKKKKTACPAWKFYIARFWILAQLMSCRVHASRHSGDS